VPLVPIDLLTEEGITGVSYLFSFAPFALDPTAQLVATTGESIAATPSPRASRRTIGPRGLADAAMTRIDMAATGRATTTGRAGSLQ
jgi:hypothetical protein